jgi:branched-chain amino acid transport system permease protein
MTYELDLKHENLQGRSMLSGLFPTTVESVLIQQLFNGLALGMAYSLIAVGYSMVFGVLRLINFAHGAIYAFSAHMALLFIGMKFGVIPAIILSIILTGLLGIFIDKTPYPLHP